ncbi:MAG TPA: transporter [Gammaproteobacteria bacterium]|nr:transporter [Gammaproteobacteria bacterium]
MNVPAVSPRRATAGTVSSLVLILASASSTALAAESQPLLLAEAGQPQVGQAPAPAPRERPEVPSISNVGGVLTPDGALVVEPSVQFVNSQVNRFTFLGVEILDTFLIGVIEAENVDRNIVSPAISLRYGMSDRFELGLKVPWVYRSETRSGTIPQASTGDGAPVTLENDISGSGLGDVEASAHFQLNTGQGGWPFFVGNIRYKFTTGRGPFEVSYNADGTEKELATGSGFRSVEPSVTVLYPSDPAVFYGNVGYLFNLKDNVNKDVGSGDNAFHVGDVDPGNALRLSIGMSLAINPRASVSFGYKHDIIQQTKTEINGVPLRSSSLDVGALTLGFTHMVGRGTYANFDLEIGATADAPDVTATVRVPFTLGG